MGWTTLQRPKGLTTKEFFEQEFPISLTEKGRIVASGIVNKVFYAAVENTDPNADRFGQVWALVCLTSTSSGVYNFGYKDMDETVGPYEASAPARVLTALTPTDNVYANEWREKCRANLARTEHFKSVKAGDVVTFLTPVRFSDNAEFTELRLVDPKKGIFTPVDGYSRYRFPRWKDQAVID